MSTVGRLVYLGADPYGGAVGLVGDTAHTARVPVQVHGPRDDSVGILVSALHVACYLQHNPEGAVVRVHRQRRPDLVRVAERLVAAGAAEQSHSGAPLDQVASDLLGMCED